MSALAFPNPIPTISDIRLDSSVAENDTEDAVNDCIGIEPVE